MDYCPVVRANPAKKTPACLYNDRTQAIADKYKKTPVQIALKYLVNIFFRKTIIKIKSDYFIIYLSGSAWNCPSSRSTRETHD